MQTLKQFFSPLVLIAVLFISCNQTDNQENIIIVQDYRDQEQPTVNLKAHKSGDVEIHRTFLMGEGYEVIYYHDFSGEIKDYHAFYGTTDSYDKASYNWKDDTTVIFKLINSKIEQGLTLEVFGNGKRSGMTMED